MIKPSGWQTIRYSFVDGKYLYNRCHLIGYQLTAENANERNLITGTRYMNVDGMLPFENMVADYVRETGNHVAYKVKPVFRGNDLLAQGVHMMAESVEDNGRGVSYNVFCYNVQPGVKIDYSDGTSKMDGSISGSVISSGDHSGGTSYSGPSSGSSSKGRKQKYVINVNTGVFHYPSCSSVRLMKNSNKKYTRSTRKALINAGYKPCGSCRP
jgi:DNA-entry nuclease